MYASGGYWKHIDVLCQETLRVSGSFEQYERMLWHVLAQLARRGYVVPPSEARDLIHDFYLEVWQGLTERYDSKRGNFSSYVFGAFYRFARRRIIRLQNWRGRLVDVCQLARYADESVDVERAADVESQVQKVSGVISGLPWLQRDILRDFLSGEEGSERRLALKYAVSRYRLREILVDTLGRVATELGHILVENPIEEQVALALWRDGRTVRDTAVLLGISVADVHAARKRLVAQMLVNLVRSKH
jgi:RNA polymerase sigma factor (sigma-70 family)